MGSCQIVGRTTIGCCIGQFCHSSAKILLKTGIFTLYGPNVTKCLREILKINKRNLKLFWFFLLFSPKGIFFADSREEVPDYVEITCTKKSMRTANVLVS